MVSLHDLKHEWTESKHCVPDTIYRAEVSKRVTFNLDDACIHMTVPPEGGVWDAVLEQPGQQDATVVGGWLYDFCVWAADRV